MATTLIVVHHNGEWDRNNSYVNFDVLGLAIIKECNYQEFYGLVAEQLKVCTSDKHVILKYQLKDAYPPISIENDACLEFYKELRSNEPDYTKFPVCTTIKSLTRDVVSYIAGGEEVPSGCKLNSSNMDNLRAAILLPRSLTETSVFEFASEAANEIVDEVYFMNRNVSDTPNDENNVVHGELEQGAVRTGQIFNTEDNLKRTLKFLALTQKFNFRVMKSCRKQYYVACVDDECGWFVKASCVGNSRIFKVRSMNNTHTCPLDVRMNEQRQATSRIVSDCIKKRLCSLKTIYTPADIMRDMKDDYGITVNYKKAWRSRRKAMEEVRGKPDESYSMVARYLELLTEANPGSFVKLHTSDNNKFKYLFISMYASINGWQHCRPIVVVDGTFLKASYGGTLLTASVQDANAHILPLAFAVVDSENDLAYEWFFDNLRAAIGTREGMCIVSDRNESLVKAVTKVYPDVAQCFCMYHLGNNLKRHFKKNTNVVRQTFIAAATAYTMDEFDNKMNELRVIDERIVKYLEGIGFDKWARVHCPHNRFMTMTSNAAESVNAALRFVRELPVTTMLECLRALQQKWNVANSDEAKATFTTLTRKGHDMIEENYKMSLRMTVQKANERIYQVSFGHSVFVVDLHEKTCTCKRFQMDELPCAHAISVLRGRNEDAIPYCSKYYYKNSMVATYVESVYPVSSDGSWTPQDVVGDEIVLPPIGRVRSGRLKRLRTPSVGEYTQKTKCGRCGIRGHNMKTCRGLPSTG